MKLYEMTPRDDYRKYIPDFLLDDDVPPETFSSIQPYLDGQRFSFRDYIGFVSGATTHQKIIADSIAREARKEQLDNDIAHRKWFKTEKLIDVRVFFRKLNDDRTMGSKVRLYSLGNPYGDRSGKRKEVQKIDSGFLTTPTAGPPSMVYQKALASTMLYNSLYCIGGPALIRKVNIPAKQDESAPSYKHVSYVRALYDKDLSRDTYTHVLTPACRAAGVPDDFFSGDMLDGVLNALMSKDYDEMLTAFTRLPEELYEDEVEAIADASNNDSASLCPAQEKDFYNTPGLNVVETMKQLHVLLKED